MSEPIPIKEPLDFSISFNGRSIPSNMFDIIPGPNVAKSGVPVEYIGSPGFNPVVLS